jgi:polysaccharide export outer membrane protein
MIRASLLSLFALLGLLAAPPLVAQDADPMLKSNDMVRMTVFGEADLTTQTRVLKSGEVVLPLIGTVRIGGLTVSKANELIRTLYAKDYLVDPKIAVTVDEYSQDFVSVIGAVLTPGQFPVPASGKFDLSSAIASAGGLAPGADPNRVLLTRASGGTSTYTAAAIESGAPIPLRPGDRITVQQSVFVNKTVTILGQVKKPGPVQFPIDGRLDLVTAIAQAGHFTDLANPKKVNLNRKGQVFTFNVKEMTDKGSQPYFLLPDDIVTVSERLF